MPKIPIIPPRAFRDGSDAGAAAGGPEALSPEQADALRALQARTARIDRELAVSRAWRVGIERLSEAEETPGGPPVGFTRGFLADLDRERQQLVTSSPAAAQEPLERDLLDLRADFLDRAAQAEASGLALGRRTGLYDALDGYVAGVAKDPGQFDRAVGRMDSLIAGLGVPEEQQDPMRSYVRTVLGDAAIRRMMDDPARTERLLAEGLYDDVLPEGVKALRLKEAQDKVARETYLTRERTVADLTARAQEGTASDEAILEAERQQTLSPAEGAYLRVRNATAALAVATRDARIRRVATATERLDPSNPEDRAAGSAYWDSVAEVHASDDPAQQQENELRFVERIDVLPKALENKYRGALLSGDPSVVAPGAVAITRLGALNPALVQEIPLAEVGRAGAIAEFVMLGVEPGRAVELGEKKAAAESARPVGMARTGEIQVAANDEPPVMSDATETGAPDEEAADPEAAADGTGIQPDGSAVVVDPETGERTTVDRESVERVQTLVDDQAALAAIRERFLETYDAFVSKDLTREEAAAALRAILDSPDGPAVSDPALREELERVASDILYAADRDAAFNVFTDRLLSPDRQIEIGREVLSYLPVVGEAISAIEAYEAFAAAIDAWQRGDTDAALRQAGEGGVAALGALPITGKAVRLTRGGVKLYRMLRRLMRRRGPKQERDKPAEKAEDTEPELLEPPLPRPRIGQYGEREDERYDAELKEAIRNDVEAALQGGKFGDRQAVTGDASNEDSIRRMRADGRLSPNQEAHPPYRSDVPAYLSTIADDGAEFVRITSNPNKPEGFWLMPKETYEEIIRNPDGVKELMQRYAIPSEYPATHVVLVKLPKGTKVRVGAANGSPELGPGGGVQIEILDPLKRTWFGKPQRLP